MPILSIIRPEIPAASKDKFLDAWPTLVADLRAQPGVLHAGGGQIVAEDGQGVTDFKFIQYIAFKSAEDEATFTSSAWAKEHEERLQARGVPQPAVGRFEFAEFSGDASPKPFLQFSSITLADEGKRVDARTAWIELTSALGRKTTGGKLLSDDAIIGLGLVGWDSVEEIESAYKESKTAEAFAAYKSIGETRNVLVKLLES
ncbi:hypothetical protein B0T10DRAFT_455262 [Thelonectria olida]|uniref:ABM domain-containing protein n=1 Tax=Thelonectria olida TaxID=1576542 RepID=A0A9P9AV72_9HYPO|nr:hypothetical protein B0T10DRAFT_455262 [Thelonectria olida]